MVAQSMKIFFAGWLALGLGFSALAGAEHDHGGAEGGHHDEEHGEEEFDLDLYSLVLKGEQGFGEACYLGLLEEGIDEAGRYFAVVETSFSHDGEGPGRLTIQATDAQNLSVLRGSSDESRIVVRLADGSSSLLDALRYAVSWTHEGHTDRGFCSDLKVVKEPAPASDVQP